MHKILTTLLVFAFVANVQHVQAAEVTFDLFADPSTGMFDLFASASLGDNAGIASYGVPLTGGILTVDHLAPIASFTDVTLPAGPFTPVGGVGFDLLRSPDGNAFVSASQDTITPNLLGMVYQIGQFAGDLSTFAPPPVGDSVSVGGEQFDGHNAPVLLASGTWDGSTIGIDLGNVNFGANVFVDDAGQQVLIAEIMANVQIGDGPPPTNTPPEVTDLFGSDPFDQHTLATLLTPASYQMKGTDTEDGNDANLDWTLDDFDGPFGINGNTRLPGLIGGNGDQTLNDSGLFEWDPTGSSRGFYFADITVRDLGTPTGMILSDMGILRVQVPEPSTLILAGLSLVGVFASRRRKS